MSEASDPLDPAAQLEMLRQRLSGTNPELYRHLALYLQVLRQVLPHRVRQACFHLATQVHPQRYAALPAERRRLMHEQIEGLVSRCSSLLTVEQLAILADQIHREQRRRERQERQHLLAELSWEDDGEQATDGSTEPETLPPGSVRLGLAPPLSGGPSRWGLPASEPPLPRGSDPLEGTARGGEDGETSDHDAGDGSDVPTDAVIEHDEDESTPEPPDGAEAPSLWQPGPLPGEPRQVLEWLDGMELALSRRLRNLSHAVNVELLRAGVSRSLLPVSLLDAVLSGQLDTMAAPANLTRLPLPFGGGPRTPQAQTMAVLLRAVELELEEPRLRTCRRRLQQHRQEVRRMAQQFRRLQRRVRIHQAEQLWLQDLQPTRNPGD